MKFSTKRKPTEIDLAGKRESSCSMADPQHNVAPGIESDSSVCGGDPCIIRTLIPVCVLVYSKLLGMCETDFLKSYLILRVENIVHYWEYEQLHR
ncbi:MAG: DUF433 domain-containing protein, partial [Pirellulales bacterium]|nr:DUF433 domain-containing protein [Pirellulales bacterium]